MSLLRQALTDYLTMRRALGYKLDKTERLVGQFVAFAENRGEAHIRTETALAWATLPADAAVIWYSRRLAEVRLFARHLRTLDPMTEVPPDDLLIWQGFPGHQITNFHYLIWTILVTPSPSPWDLSIWRPKQGFRTE